MDILAIHGHIVEHSVIITVDGIVMIHFIVMIHSSAYNIDINSLYVWMDLFTVQF